MRSLFVLEDYFWERSKKNYHPGFIVSVLLNKPIPDDVLTETLRLTGEDFPQLFQRIEEGDGTQPAKIVPISKTLLTEDVIIHVEDDEANGIFGSYKLEPTSEGCSWIIFVRENRLTLLADHTLFDGMSAFNLLNAVITYANKGVTSLNKVIYNANAPSPSPPSVHPFDEFRTTLAWKLKAKIAPIWMQYISPIFSKIFPSQNFEIPEFDLRKHLFTADEVIKQDNCHYRWNISAEKLGSILRHCREHNVTLTVWICAKIVEQLTKLKKSTKGNLISMQIPMNQRPYLVKTLGKDPKSIAVGTYISVSNCTVDLAKDNLKFWSLVKIVQDQLNKSKEDPISGIEYVKLLEQIDIKNFVLAKFSGTFPDSTFELSNLGLLDPSSTEDAYQLLDAEFQQPKLASSLFCCSAISTRLGGCRIVISYPLALKDLLTPLFENL